MKLKSTHFIAALAFAVLCMFGVKGFYDAKRDMERFAQQERERISKETLAMKYRTPEDILKSIDTTNKE